MSVNGIIKQIEQDAKSEVEQIRQKYGQQVEKLESEFEARREKALTEAGEKAEQERKKSYRQALEHRRSFLSRKLLAHKQDILNRFYNDCLLYTSPSPRDLSTSRMPSSA